MSNVCFDSRSLRGSCERCANAGSHRRNCCHGEIVTVSAHLAERARSDAEGIPWYMNRGPQYLGPISSGVFIGFPTGSQHDRIELYFGSRIPWGDQVVEEQNKYPILGVLDPGICQSKERRYGVPHMRIDRLLG